MDTKLPLADPKPACTGWLAVTMTVVDPFILVVETETVSVASVITVVDVTVVAVVVFAGLVCAVSDVEVGTGDTKVGAGVLGAAASAFGSVSVVATGAGSWVEIVDSAGAAEF